MYAINNWIWLKIVFRLQIVRNKRQHSRESAAWEVHSAVQRFVPMDSVYGVEQDNTKAASWHNTQVHRSRTSNWLIIRISKNNLRVTLIKNFEESNVNWWENRKKNFQKKFHQGPPLHFLKFLFFANGHKGGLLWNFIWKIFWWFLIFLNQKLLNLQINWFKSIHRVFYLINLMSLKVLNMDLENIKIPKEIYKFFMLIRNSH